MRTPTPRRIRIALVALPLLAAVALACAAARPASPAISLRFTPAAPPVPVGPMPTAPVPADLDHDGDTDIVVICGPCCGREACPESGHAMVLLNDGSGRLAPAGLRIPLGPTALGAAVADINHDTHPDIVAFHHNDYDAAILLGDGTGRFAAPAYVALHSGDSPHVHSIAIADVNHDTHPDILATLVDDHALAVLLGDGTGAFTPALGQPFFAHRHPYAQLAIVDFNDDSHPDAFMTDVRGNGLTVLAGSGTGMFAPINGFDLNTTMPIAAAERPGAAALADLDADADLDAIAFIEESPHAVRMINTGGGRFVQAAASPLIDLGINSVGGRIADVTGDGVPDIIASGTMTNRFSICPGRPDGTFGPPIVIDAGGDSPGVAIGDMNADGRLDIITGNYESGTVSVLLNTGGT